MRAISYVRRLKHVLGVSLRSDAHVFLAQRLCMLLDVGIFLKAIRLCHRRRAEILMTYQLLRQRHLLKLHLVDAGNGGRGQRARCEENSRLHDGNKRSM